jgi:hypothetical protein
MYEKLGRYASSNWAYFLYQQGAQMRSMTEIATYLGIIVIVFAGGSARADAKERVQKCDALSAPGHYPDYEAMPRYSIEQSDRSADGEALHLHVYLSIEASLSETSYLRVACKVKTEHNTDSSMAVWFFDNKSAARDVALHAMDAKGNAARLWHLRGRYVLDRKSGKDFVEFVFPGVADDILILNRIKVRLQ